MAEQLVPLVRTVVSMRDYARAVLRAWHTVGSGMPDKRSVAVLWAQYMIETGGAASWNWNIGNVKHVAGDGFDYHMLRGTWEGEPKAVADALIAKGLAVLDPNPNHQRAVAPRVAVLFQPPHPATWFRAYPSLDVSMMSHLSLLARKKYKRAWPYVVAGDFRGFAKALKEGPDGVENTRDDYFTASSQAYAAGMAGHFAAFVASPVFDEELAALISAREAETVPELPDPPSKPTVLVEESQPIVHPKVPLGRPTLDDE